MSLPFRRCEKLIAIPEYYLVIDVGNGNFLCQSRVKFTSLGIDDDNSMRVSVLNNHDLIHTFIVLNNNLHKTSGSCGQECLIHNYVFYYFNCFSLVFIGFITDIFFNFLVAL